MYLNAIRSVFEFCYKYDQIILCYTLSLRSTYLAHIKNKGLCQKGEQCRENAIKVTATA